MSTHTLDPADLAASLAAAQADIAAAPAGSAHTWVLPAGEFELSAGAAAGVAGRALTLHGPGTVLTVGDPAVVAGDAVGLDVAGTDVRVEGVTVRVRAAGTATGLRVRASATCAVAGVLVDGVQGATATGVDAAAPSGSLTAVQVAGVAASAGDATGVLMRCTGELGVLDVAVDGVTGTADATGAVLVCAGDVAVRGAGVQDVQGARAGGAVLVAGVEIDWSGGRVATIRGTAGGAVGVRVLAGPDPAAVRLDDLSIAGIGGAQPGLAAEPADSWRTWLDLAAAALAAGAELPRWPAAGDPGHVEQVAAVHVCAPVDEGLPWLADTDPGPVELSQCVLERIGGTAVAVVADLRDVQLRGLLVWTAARAGHVEGERVLLARCTLHRLGFGLGFGPCSLTAADTLVTGVGAGGGVLTGPDTEVLDALVVPAAGGLPPFEPEPVPLPYLDPGPADIPAALLAGDVVPDAPHDLRVNAALHRRAVRVPGDDDDAPIWVGALAPDLDARCDLRDPDPPPAEQPAPAAVPLAGPVVDYRVRDARGLLAVMTGRARQVMPGWTPDTVADQTTMLLELLAERLDALAYRQEVALSEGSLPDAATRRSVEDHVRLVDYVPDPGLSATTMLRFRLDADGARALGVDGGLARGGVVIGADTLVVNADAADRIVVFGTESDLAVVPELDSMLLAQQDDLEPGATTAVEAGDTDALLAGDRLDLTPGRWLVLVGVDPQDPQRLDPDVPAHVVRLTRVEVGTDTTRVLWDPRRPAPVRYERDRCRVLGNVVPAHHGIPLTPLTAGVDPATDIAVLEQADLLTPWRERLTVTLPQAGDPAPAAGAGVTEIGLPVDRVSVRASGWPFPDAAPRTGQPQIRLAVDGENWSRVEDLVVAEAGDEVFAVRTGAGDTPAVRLGPGSRPDRDVTVDLAIRVGLGTAGNVGVGSMTRLLALGPGGDREALLGDGGADRIELLRRLLTVTNPVPGVGGREPEDIEQMRYRAPLGVRDALSAVVPLDYERLVAGLPEVAAARAVVRPGPLAPVVRMTMLLRGEDALAAAGEQGQAERLRRWALARARLEQVRLLGFDVELVPPRFVPLDLDVIVDVPDSARNTAEDAVRRALGGPDGLFDPDVSGLGGDVRVDAVHRRLLAVPGVQAVRVRRLRRLEPGAPERVHDGVLPVEPDEVAILDHPYGPAFPSGLLTVGVCTVGVGTVAS